MYRADMGVIQCGSGASFALKSLQRRRVIGVGVAQALNGNMAPEAKIFSVVDNPHSSAAKPSQNPIVLDGLPGT
jgi:hypothetical protein